MNVNKTNVVAFNIYLSAENYHWLSLLSAQNSRDLIYKKEKNHFAHGASIVSAALNAFSCELFLKSIYFLENSKEYEPPTHKLDILFAALSQPAKDKIENYYNAEFDSVLEQQHAYWLTRVPHAKKGTINPLMDTLEKGKHSFESFRYFYQYRKPDKIVAYDAISFLVLAIRRYFKDVQPSWPRLID